jgi:uracil-DNA glycosylase
MLATYLKEKSWNNVLVEEFEKEYFKNLDKFLTKEYAEQEIFPIKEQVFTAFNETSLDNVKVVVIGQDPYHGIGQAHGLCFSVLPGIKIPPSLKNIFKELNSDLNIEIPASGNLLNWSKEGVLLLNSILTVRKATPMSHQKKGWEDFTLKVIQNLNDQKENLVFMAWGSPAIAKIASVNRNKHLVLTNVHPSPLSAYRGFLGCKHFSKCNDYLVKNGKKPINWSLN